MCLVVVAFLFLGLIVITYQFVTNGRDWASFYGNTQIFSEGKLNRGTVEDRNGLTLLSCTDDGLVYNSDSSIRLGTMHAVGDLDGNIASGAINKWRAELIGYDLLNGTYDTTAEGQTISLTIDAEANAVAYDALAGRTGVVGVYNYETGEIMCMVSSPSYDPDEGEPDSSSSVYFNPFYQGTLTPGSTFKLVTAAAAIDNVSDIDSFTFTCTGSVDLGGATITCTSAHGTVDFDEALVVSCNCAFGVITESVGAETMEEYFEQVGLSESVDVDGITTAAGSATFSTLSVADLQWAGIGQAEDAVNPCALMVYMGAIANGGEAIQPYILKESNFLSSFTSSGTSLGDYLSESTAEELKAMMKNNVEVTYGESNFPGLDIYAKSGTAEVGNDTPNAWFVGFIDDPDHPYAFVVWIEEGGYGSTAAAPVANAVLQELVANN